MAFNEELANRIRLTIEPIKDQFNEKKMFGGLCFMYKNKMSIGIVKDELMVRVITEKYSDLLNKPHVREMNFTGRTMKNFVFISDKAIETEEQLTEFIHLGMEHAESVQ
jgi:TfoX/Sxy family transcriptional regulator of competence genes